MYGNNRTLTKSLCPLLGFALIGMFTACGAEPSGDIYDEVANKQSALSCSGVDCVHLDPHTTGCDVGAKTMDSVPHADGTLEIRWSPTCDAKWARVTRSGYYESYAWLEQTAGSPLYLTWDGQATPIMWSNMWYAPKTKLRACAFITWCSGDCGAAAGYTCTAMVEEP